MKVANGIFTCNKKKFLLVDLPGTYSLMSNSQEEEIARDYICTQNPNVTLIVLDATCLERNLNLVYQIMELTDNIVVCVNLLDEASAKGIHIDLHKLSILLGVPVVGTTARNPKTLKNLALTINKVCEGKLTTSPISVPFSLNDTEKILNINLKSEEICRQVCTFDKKNYNERDRKIDKILTSKTFGFPIMLLMLGIIFWITIVGANYPTMLLTKLFAYFETKLVILFDILHLPAWFKRLIYKWNIHNFNMDCCSDVAPYGYILSTFYFFRRFRCIASYCF